MRTFGPIASPMPCFMHAFQTRIAKRRAVRLQFILQGMFWADALVLQQFPHDPKHRPLVPMSPNQGVQDLALSIDGAPQVHLFAACVHRNLVQMPSIECRRAALADPASIGSSVFQRPRTSCFVADVDPFSARRSSTSR